MAVPNKLLKPYDPIETEPRIYKLWEESGFFNPDKLPCIALAKQGKILEPKPFTIMMPPPNATGVLHMGHASMLAIEDIMIRYHRMQGDRTLYLPGTDHASIATQSRVEKEIYKTEGKSRHDLGREELLQRIEKFVEKNRGTMTSQMRVMGASCDWSREAFTLDEKRSLAVRTMFKKMYDDELIYRGHRIVNWDPKGQTTVSDDEIVHEERKAKMYTFKYSKNFPISISTTRPETKVGDTAVAVHPDDLRYQKYIGQIFKIENFCNMPLEIKIVADNSVEKDFGTGALGVTPAHSTTDWEIAKRHNLPIKQVINEYAKMSVDAPELKNKKTTEAREIIIDWLKRENLLEKEEEINQNVSTAERTGGIIEPLPKLQWFVAVNKSISSCNKTLKEIMRKPVAEEKIKLIPEHFTKTYFNWIDNLRDWCISRQIWYGHRIPVWYKGSEIYCDINPPKSEGWEQDPDTLDTWFSSALWTFSTLGWPNETNDLKIYHPTDVLETGYEIIFFWVARMIMMTGYALEAIPFHTVYFHGTVRDQKGRKMSKSLGNGIDPIDVAKKFGADAGRMSLIVGSAPGTDLKLAEDKIKGYKHFANKIWNISRFVLENTEDLNFAQKPELTEEDQGLLDELEALKKEMTHDIENFKFYLAGEKIYHYIWHRFADIILEESKKIFAREGDLEKNSRKWFLLETLKYCLKLLHPFMPFITEELWQILKSNFKGNPKFDFFKSQLLMIEKW